MTSRLLFSWTAKYIVAHMHTDEVPIAVLRSWRKYIPPHSKMLFVMISAIASMMVSSGKPIGRQCFRLCIHSVMTRMVCPVLWLVYMDVASAINKRDPGGSKPSDLKIVSNWFPSFR